jgi:outer membrane biosynthesis protein TonB
MTENAFNPEAIDGDKDGIVQEGTEFERSVEDLLENPVEEVKTEEPEVSPEVTEEPQTPEAAEVEVTQDVVSEPASEEKVVEAVAPKPTPKPKTDKPVTKAAPKAEEEKKKDKPELVAVFASTNLVWSGLGRLSKGYNLVAKDDAARWLTHAKVREASPEEVKSRLA